MLVHFYAFVYKAGSTEEPPLGPDTDTMMAHPNYAGLGGVFAGKADVCTNCQNSIHSMCVSTSRPS